MVSFGRRTHSQRQPPKCPQEYTVTSFRALEKKVAEKFHENYLEETVMKSFLSLVAVHNFTEKEHHSYFSMTKISQNSCYVE